MERSTGSIQRKGGSNSDGSSNNDGGSNNRGGSNNSNNPNDSSNSTGSPNNNNNAQNNSNIPSRPMPPPYPRPPPGQRMAIGGRHEALNPRERAWEEYEEALAKWEATYGRRKEAERKRKEWEEKQKKEKKSEEEQAKRERDWEESERLERLNRDATGDVMDLSGGDGFGGGSAGSAVSGDVAPDTNRAPAQKRPLTRAVSRGGTSRGRGGSAANRNSGSAQGGSTQSATSGISLTSAFSSTFNFITGGESTAAKNDGKASTAAPIFGSGQGNNYAVFANTSSMGGSGAQSTTPAANGAGAGAGQGGGSSSNANQNAGSAAASAPPVTTPTPPSGSFTFALQATPQPATASAGASQGAGSSTGNQNVGSAPASAPPVTNTMPPSSNFNFAQHPPPQPVTANASANQGAGSSTGNQHAGSAPGSTQPAPTTIPSSTFSTFAQQAPPTASNTSATTNTAGSRTTSAQTLGNIPCAPSGGHQPLNFQSAMANYQADPEGDDDPPSSPEQTDPAWKSDPATRRKLPMRKKKLRTLQDQPSEPTPAPYTPPNPAAAPTLRFDPALAPKNQPMGSSVEPAAVPAGSGGMGSGAAGSEQGGNSSVLSGGSSGQAAAAAGAAYLRNNTVGAAQIGNDDNSIADINAGILQPNNTGAPAQGNAAPATFVGPVAPKANAAAPTQNAASGSAVANNGAGNAPANDEDPDFKQNLMLELRKAIAEEDARETQDSNNEQKAKKANDSDDGSELSEDQDGVSNQPPPPGVVDPAARPFQFTFDPLNAVQSAGPQPQGPALAGYALEQHMVHDDDPAQAGPQQDSHGNIVANDPGVYNTNATFSPTQESDHSPNDDLNRMDEVSASGEDTDMVEAPPTGTGVDQMGKTTIAPQPTGQHDGLDLTDPRMFSESLHYNEHGDPVHLQSHELPAEDMQALGQQYGGMPQSGQPALSQPAPGQQLFNQPVFDQTTYGQQNPDEAYHPSFDQEANEQIHSQVFDAPPLVDEQMPDPSELYQQTPESAPFGHRTSDSQKSDSQASDSQSILGSRRLNREDFEPLYFADNTDGSLNEALANLNLRVEPAAQARVDDEDLYSATPRTSPTRDQSPARRTGDEAQLGNQISSQPGKTTTGLFQQEQAAGQDAGGSSVPISTTMGQQLGHAASGHIRFSDQVHVAPQASDNTSGRRNAPSRPQHVTGQTTHAPSQGRPSAEGGSNTTPAPVSATPPKQPGNDDGEDQVTCDNCCSPVPRKDIVQLPCSHHWCRECLNIFFESWAEDADSSQPECCDTVIQHSSVEHVLTAEVREKVRIRLATTNSTHPGKTQDSQQGSSNDTPTPSRPGPNEQPDPAECIYCRNQCTLDNCVHLSCSHYCCHRCIHKLFQKYASVLDCPRPRCVCDTLIQFSLVKPHLTEDLKQGVHNKWAATNRADTGHSRDLDTGTHGHGDKEGPGRSQGSDRDPNGEEDKVECFNCELTVPQRSTLILVNCSHDWCFSCLRSRFADYANGLTPRLPSCCDDRIDWTRVKDILSKKVRRKVEEKMKKPPVRPNPGPGTGDLASTDHPSSGRIQNDFHASDSAPAAQGQQGNDSAQGPAPGGSRDAPTQQSGLNGFDDLKRSLQNSIAMAKENRVKQYLSTTVTLLQDWHDSTQQERFDDAGDCAKEAFDLALSLAVRPELIARCEYYVAFHQAADKKRNGEQLRGHDLDIYQEGQISQGFRNARKAAPPCIEGVWAEAWISVLAKRGSKAAYPDIEGEKPFSRPPGSSTVDMTRKAEQEMQELRIAKERASAISTQTKSGGNGSTEAAQRSSTIASRWSSYLPDRLSRLMGGAGDGGNVATSNQPVSNPNGSLVKMPGEFPESGEAIGQGVTDL